MAALVLTATMLVGARPTRAQAQAPLTHPTRLDPKVREQCLNAHEEAQAARIARHFGEARTNLRACAQEACPGLVREDCVGWLGDLAKMFPSVIVDANVDGQQAISTHVYLDGKLIVDHLDGKTVELDPGEHKVRFELPGFPPQEQVVVVSEGVQDRVVTANFHHDVPLPAPTPAPPGQRPVPPTVWISGAVAIGALASTAVFGSLALSEKSSLSQSCRPFCSDSQLGTLREYALAADVSVGVAAAAAVVGGGLFLMRPERPRPNSISFSAAPLPGNGGLLATRLIF